MTENNHWMNILQIDSTVYREDRETLMNRLDKNGIQTRPVWMFNHLQKPYLKSQNHQIEYAHDLYQTSLCIPSSVGLTKSEINKIIERIRNYL